METKNKTSEFVISRTYPVSKEKLWKAFTDSKEMAKWWGPKGVVITHSKMDLRPGGMYLYAMKAPNGNEWWGRMVYREIVPAEKIFFVNSFSDPKGGLAKHPMNPKWPKELLSTFSFKGDAKQAIFTVHWTPLNPTAEELASFEAGHDSMTGGWTGTLDQLGSYLSKC